MKFIHRPIYLALLPLIFFMGCSVRSQYSEEIEMALDWGNLDILPASAENVQVDVRGGMFSKQVILSFICSESCINSWIRSSPGLAGREPETVEGVIRVYTIRPGYEGSVGGTVTIDDKAKIVTIDMSWS